MEHSYDYRENLERVRRSYDAMVEVRDRKPAEEWKQRERESFLERVRADGGTRLLEVGAGTGLHGKWFADAGLEVLCTDASAAMVEACRAKGLDALQMDFLSLDPAGTFDAVFAMNCLLHVPPDDLHAALCAIHDVLVPGGWFFLGQYGGFERASTWAEDVYEPKRFFSYLSDDALLGAVARVFDVVEFHTVDVDGLEPGAHFQAFTLRRAS